MNRHSAVVMLAVLFSIGCSQTTPLTSAEDASDTVITKDRVGNYVIGKSTLTEILGDDTPEARTRFAKEGLNFEFDRGVTLTGVTVSSPRYRMANGLVAGSSVDDVRKALGEPNQTEIASEKFRIDALVYDDFTFILNDDQVGAIRIGSQ